METLAPQGISPLQKRNPNSTSCSRRDRKDDWHRWQLGRDCFGFVFHVILLIVLLLMPESEVRVYEAQQPIVRFTPLYIPTELTQERSEQRQAQQKN